MTNTTRKWIRGGVEILIHGGASALMATIVTWLHDHKDWHFFSRPFWDLAAFQFIGSGGIRWLQWWSNNPLPPENGTSIVDKSGTPLVPAAQISLNPLSKVQPLQPDPLAPKP